jgi:large subunit ribosomal protein L15
MAIGTGIISSTEFIAGRLDTSQPVDLAALLGTKTLSFLPDRNHFGLNLTSDGTDTFRARLNIEVQWASEQAIAAVERAGGRITTAYYDLHSVIALSNPIAFFKSGAPIPRRLSPPGNLLEYYIEPGNRGYLADPARVAEERLVLAQKYGYEPPDYSQQEDWMNETKGGIALFFRVVGRESWCIVG